jgi:hypothetical protein
MKPSKSCDNCEKTYYGDVSTHISSGSGVSYVTGTGISGMTSTGYVISSGGGGGGSNYVLSSGRGESSGYILSSDRGVGGISPGYRSSTAGIAMYGTF